MQSNVLSQTRVTFRHLSAGGIFLGRATHVSANQVHTTAGIYLTDTRTLETSSMCMFTCAVFPYMIPSGGENVSSSTPL